MQVQGTEEQRGYWTGGDVEHGHYEQLHNGGTVMHWAAALLFIFNDLQATFFYTLLSPPPLKFGGGGYIGITLSVRLYFCPCV